MSIHKEPKIPKNQADSYSRMGLFGDMPTRGIAWFVARGDKIPPWLEKLMVTFFSVVVLILAKEQRRAIRGNLKVIFPDLAFFEGYAGVLRVFCNFGYTYVDGMRARSGNADIAWELEGREYFNQVRDSQEATLIVTTHTGNYDLAAAIFSNQFGRTLWGVRMPERSEQLQELREKELAVDAARYPHFKTLYNRSMNMLGVELARLLGENQLVALQGDRVIGEVAAMTVPFREGGPEMRIPKGPLTLAVMGNCPCYPLFVVRVGFRRYRIIFREPLATEELRNKRMEGLATAWVDELRKFLEVYGWQWLVFEPAFVKEE